jgi:hypothetical protein
MPLQRLAWTLRARPANPSTLPSRSLHYRPGPIWSPKLRDQPLANEKNDDQTISGIADSATVGCSLQNNAGAVQSPTEAVRRS